MIDAVSEKKFLSLKKRLDALHYCQPFTLDSASLIERLLNDLIKTTEGFQSIKKTNEELKIAVNKSDQKLEPLKKENVRILKENNELHAEIMRVKEEAEYKEVRWNNTRKSLEDDKTDLKHVLNQKDAKYSKLEDEYIALKKKVEVLIRKHGRDSENIPGEANLSVVGGRSARFEVTKTLRPNDIEEELEGKNDYKTWAENLRKADEKVNSLKEELKNSTNLRVNLEEQIKHLEIQVNNRNKEIKRLQARLDVSDPNVDKISTEYSLKTNSEIVDKLNANIDFLTKENLGLEDMVKDLKRELSRTDNLRTHNSNLELTIKELTQKNEELRTTLRNNERMMETLKDTKALSEQEMNNKKDRKIDVLEEEVQKLSRRVDELRNENLRLKMEADKAGQTLSAYNSDKLAFGDVIQGLKEGKSDAEAQIQTLQSDLERKIQENENLRDSLTAAQGKVQSLQREIDLFKINISKNTEDQRFNQEVSSNLRGRISELETENINLNSQRAELETQLERANRLREHLEDQLERFKSDTYKSKSNLDTSDLAKKRYQTMYEEAQKDIEFLKRDIKDLENKLLDEKRVSMDLEAKSNDYFSSMKESQDKIKSLEREVEVLNEQLSTRLQEIRRSEALRTEVERDYVAMKGSNAKLEEQLEKNKRLREDIKKLEDERIASLKKLDDFAFEIRELNEKISRQEDTIRREREAKEALSEKLDMLASESENFDLGLKRAKERELEYNRVMSELDAAKRRERKAIEETEALRREIRKQESLIANGTKQVEHINHQKDELLNEIKILRDEMLTLKSSDNDAKTKSIKLQEKVNNFEIMMADLKDERLKDEKQIYAMEDDIRRLRSDLEKERRTNGDLNEQVQQLTTLAESLENTREELLTRLQNKNNERNMDEGERARLQDDMRKLREMVNNLERENEEMRNALMEVDRERDTLQAQLDDKSEKLERLRREFEETSEENRRFKERSSEFMASSDMQLSRMQDLEGQLKELHRRSKALYEENNELKRVLSVKDTDIDHLGNDLNILTRENQNLNQKIQMLVEEKERAKEVLGTVGNQEKTLKQSLRAVELEREDILNNYRAVCVENERLKRNNEELTADNQEFFRRLNDNQREISYLNAQLQQYEVKESQYMNELAAYERNVSMLNRRLEQADNAVRAGHEAKDKLLREFNSIRQANEGFETSHDDLQRNFIRNEQERAILQDQIRELRDQQEILRQQVEYEKNRARKLEEILTEERKIQYKQNMEIQALENERMELQMTAGNSEKHFQEFQRDLSRDIGGFDSLNNTRDGQAPIHLEQQVSALKQRLDTKDSEIEHLIEEQRSLREENSRLKLKVFKEDTERSERGGRLQESIGSTGRGGYDKPYSEGTHSSKGFSEGGWDKLKMESETFKKNLEEASLSSQYLKERVKSLQKDYREFLPDSKGGK